MGGMARVEWVTDRSVALGRVGLRTDDGGRRTLAAEAQRNLRLSHDLKGWLGRALSGTPERYLTGIFPDNSFTKPFGGWEGPTKSLLLCSIDVKRPGEDRLHLVLAVAELTREGEPPRTENTWVVVDEERKMVELSYQSGELRSAPVEVLANLTGEDEERITAAGSRINDTGGRIPLTGDFHFERFWG